MGPSSNSKTAAGSEAYTFDCGCSFPVVGPPPREGALPRLSFDINKVPMDCPAVWAMLARGHVKGVFQLESPLGRLWVKKLKPTHKFHMGALGALLRPGPLQARDEEGKSMAEHYTDRKDGKEAVASIHPLVDDILCTTFGVMLFQEQSMRMAAELGEMGGIAVDRFRKGIGKKDQALLSKLGVEFSAACAEAGLVPTDVVEKVWGWIKATGRYQFNKAHADCYGVRGYKTAWAKWHNPPGFFAAWLATARYKSDPNEEIRELVNEARLFGVHPQPPNLKDLQPNVWTDGVEVHFGLADVKGIGEGVVNKLMEAVPGAEEEVGKKMGDWSWFDLLAHHGLLLPKAKLELLIRAGAVRHGLARRYMLEELNLYDRLTEKEKEWARAAGKLTLLEVLEAGARLANPYTTKDIRDSLRQVGRKELNTWLKERFDKSFSSASVEQLLEAQAAFGVCGEAPKEPGACHSEERVQVWEGLIAALKSPPTPFVDTPAWIARNEQELLGAALTITRADTVGSDMVNCSCYDFQTGRQGTVVLGVEVQQLRETETKGGKTPGRKMARLVLADSTAAINDAVVFPDDWERLSAALYEGAAVVVSGQRDGAGGLIVKGAWPA